MLGLSILTWFMALLTASLPAAQQIPVPHPDMRELDFLVGEWTLTVEGLNFEGEVVHRSRGSWNTTREMGGLVLVSTGYAEDGRLAALDWKFFNQHRQKLYDVQFDLAGNFEVRESVGEADDLAFSLVEPFIGDDGVPRDWRKTLRKAGPAAYEVETHYTEDRGRTWILGFRERYTRVSAEAVQRGPLRRTSDHDRLQFLVGEWDTELIPAGGGQPLPGRVTFEWDVGGVWLTERYSVEFPNVGTRHELGVMTFDARTETIVGYWVDNLSARMTPFSGRWTDTGTLVLSIPEVTTPAGETVATEITYTEESPTQVVMVQQQSRNGAEPVELVRIKMRRRAARRQVLPLGNYRPAILPSPLLGTSVESVVATRDGTARSSEASRAAILDAAAVEFAARGFTGARIEHIAKGHCLFYRYESEWLPASSACSHPVPCGTGPR